MRQWGQDERKLLSRTVINWKNQFKWDSPGVTVAILKRLIPFSFSLKSLMKLLSGLSSFIFSSKLNQEAIGSQPTDSPNFYFIIIAILRISFFFLSRPSSRNVLVEESCYLPHQKLVGEAFWQTNSNYLKRHKTLTRIGCMENNEIGHPPLQSGCGSLLWIIMKNIHFSWNLMCSLQKLWETIIRRQFSTIRPFNKLGSIQ